MSLAQREENAVHKTFVNFVKKSRRVSTKKITNYIREGVRSPGGLHSTQRTSGNYFLILNER